MEISRHCSFCEHKEFDFSTGNFCGLTKKKADFSRKCPKITFGNNAKEEIARINLEYQALKEQKTAVISHLILYILIGLALIVIDIFATIAIFEAGWITTYTLVGFAIGMSVIGYAFTPYIKYTNANSVVTSEKKRMDDLLQLYDYGYEINFEDENYQTAVTFHRSKVKLR
ncbi:hypothetical protein IMCC3317_03120 [Kordia antarctica]|uniref:Uncharacterized protein n=1 Tax=Kordia antarctica TaxID=1218801 RepID=A0A7L4ZFJ0_9FLAO|nr:hypothetical protein [Kordia antarctica]QHI34966.1 hypothetical protein IMCC3317_03120 [Kordia antarctica]